MNCSSDFEDIDENSHKKLMLISDTHLHEADECVQELIYNINKHKSETDSDELIVAGDISKNYKVDQFLEADFDDIKMVKGNNDEWDFDMNEDLPIDCGKSINWTEYNNNGGIDFFLTHEPQNVYLRGTSKEAKKFIRPCDVIIHGHSHLPYVRSLKDGRLAIGAGSTFVNYINDDLARAIMPRKSFHTIEIDDKEITIEHIDYKTGKEIEKSKYIKDENGYDSITHQNEFGVDMSMYEYLSSTDR